MSRRNCFQRPLLPGLRPPFFSRASRPPTPCLFIDQDGGTLLKNFLSGTVRRRRTSEIFQSRGESEPSGGGGGFCGAAATITSSFRGTLCARLLSHSSLQGLLTLISLVSSLFGGRVRVCVRACIREIPASSRMGRRLLGGGDSNKIKSGAGEVGRTAAAAAAKKKQHGGVFFPPPQNFCQ